MGFHWLALLPGRWFVGDLGICEAWFGFGGEFFDEIVGQDCAVCDEFRGSGFLSTPMTLR